MNELVSNRWSLNHLYYSTLTCYPKLWGKSKGIWKWSPSSKQEGAKKKKKKFTRQRKCTQLQNKWKKKNVLINMEGQLKWELHPIFIHSTDFNQLQNCYKHIN